MARGWNLTMMQPPFREVAGDHGHRGAIWRRRGAEIPTPIPPVVDLWAVAVGMLSSKILPELVPIQPVAARQELGRDSRLEAESGGVRTPTAEARDIDIDLGCCGIPDSIVTTDRRAHGCLVTLSISRPP